ncbi:WD_0964 family protein [Wolbachia endosymbiont (group B) of Melanostoma mellinum]|uniref:WD_0964 family protein n=1 Tax=Wolbachia endosymbiont (group B) of Melanostoma mellinum TaxID=2954030 RepID=UPI00222EA949|nr:hypothetical protein [Wolbachia endosymbiont (group B) of Melanostoma mellinum]
MYNIFGYFEICDKQSGKLDGKSYQYTTRDHVTIYFNNTLASLGGSWREFKEEAYGFIYDIGAWLKETYENLTERPEMHNFYVPEKLPVKAEEIEMKELNRKPKPFKTPPIQPTSRSSSANTSNQVVVTRHTPEATKTR